MMRYREGEFSDLTRVVGLAFTSLEVKTVGHTEGEHGDHCIIKSQCMHGKLDYLF